MEELPYPQVPCGSTAQVQQRPLSVHMPRDASTMSTFFQVQKRNFQTFSPPPHPLHNLCNLHEHSERLT